jgi:membrane protease YdiL (CAAX protease family)
MNPILKKTILTFLGVVGLSVSMTVSFFKLPDNYLVYELHFNMIRRGVLLFITFWLMWYIKVPKMNHNIFNRPVDLFTVLMTIVYFSYEIYKLPIDIYQHSLFIGSKMLIGVFEELFFRVVLFRLIFCLLVSSSSCHILTKAALITSFLFGVAHYTNLVHPSSDLLSVVNQTIFAFAVGMMMQVVLVKTRSLLLVICLHGVWDYTRGNQRLFVPSEMVPRNIAHSLEDFIGNIVVFGFLAMIVAAISILILKTVKHAEDLYR